MSQKNPPDWFARCVAIAGLLLSIAVAYYNYHWQKMIHDESTAERILVRLTASRGFSGQTKTYEPKGRIDVVVTNIGLRSIYLKRVSMTVGDADVSKKPFVVGPGSVVRIEVPQVALRIPFYDADGLNATEPVKLLQPSESVNYTKSWDFSVYPLQRWSKADADAKQEEIELEVETTKKEFRFPHQSLNEEIHWIPPVASTP